MEQKLSSSQIVYSKYNESEADLRAWIDDMMKRVAVKDLEMRKKDEEVFNLNREIQSLKSDIKNM